MVFDPAIFVTLVQQYGYFGAFLAGFLSSFTLFIPSPTFIGIFFIGGVMNPVLVGVFAALGSTLGESISYLFGLGISKAAKKKYKKTINKIKKWFHKYKPSVIIFVFAATPLPFDVVGIVAGIVNYDKRKFFLATLAGKMVKFIMIAVAGYYILPYVIDVF
jgi:membrane protein YqaA with SNARE-associated domain